MPELDAVRKNLEKYRTIVDSARNRRTREMWAETRSIVLDKWRGCPRPVNEIGRPPVCAWLGSQFLRELFGTDLARYYSEPLYFLEHWLKTKIFHFETFDDDNYYDDFIQIWLGEGFEATLWGMTMRRDATKDPWIDRSRPVISPGRRPSELPPFDFETAGLMPLARRFYEELSEITGPFGFDVGFQNWGNGPLMTANYLAGVETLAMAFLTDQDFAQQLMEHVTERRIAWTLRRAEYLGQPIAKGEMLDDDVSVPLISPRVYRDFIFPAEKKLADFHGGVAYWHDCGPAEPYLEAVSRLGRVELMHAGPFTDPAAVARVFGNSAALEIHVRPASIHDNPELLRQNLSKTCATCREMNVAAYTIRLTAYRMPSLDLSADLAAVQRWVNCKELFSQSKCLT